MSASDSTALDVVRALEAEFPVEELVHDGVMVWPIARLAIGRAVDIRRGALVPTEGPTGTPRTTRMRRALPRLRPLGRGGAEPLAAVVLSHVGGRHITVDGAGFDVFADPLVRLGAETGRRVEVWDAAYLDDRRPPFGQPRPIDLQLGLAALAARTPRSRRALAVALGEGLGDIAAAARTAGAEVTAAGLATRIGTVLALADRFAAPLAARRPALGFVVCFYNTAGFAFDIACARQGVISVDVQHGVQGPDHVNYGRLTRPGLAASTAYPRRFWSWSATDAAWIDENFGAGRAIVGGRLADIERPAGTGALPPPAGREILVSLQPGRDLPATLTEAIVDAPAGWRWWLRPHPSSPATSVQAKVDAAGLGDSVEVAAAAGADLSVLLRRVDLHVTEWSSVVLEAEAAGVPSVVLDERGRRLFGDSIRRGRTVPVEDAATLLEVARSARPLEIDEARPDPRAAFSALLAAADHQRHGV